MATVRLSALNCGPGSYAASTRMPVRGIGTMDTWDAQYPGHRFHYPMSRVVIAAHAAGLRAIDGPVADFRDLEVFRASCLTARGLGFGGKRCIHPAQIEIANQVFSPTPEEVAWAERVVAAYAEVRSERVDAISVDGIMVDEASVKIASMPGNRAYTVLPR